MSIMKKKMADSDNMKSDLKEGKPSISIALSVQRKNKKKKKMAEGGPVDSDKKSIAEQIGSPFGPQPPKPSPSPMASGGNIADAIMHKIKKEMYADGGMVDIDSNGEEQPNEYYDLNEEALDHNLDSDMDDVEQPMDSNEHGDSIDSDEHDMVESLRKRIKSRRGF